VIGQIHEQFISVVREGRGGRLRENEDLFSGLIWTGVDAFELGLIDGLGDDRFVAREVIGIDRMVVFKPKRTALQLLLEDLGIAIGNRILNWQMTPQWR
jgi:protease IV